MSAEGGAAGFTIRLADGGPEFTCFEGDTMLRAALRNGVGLPYECASGGCGACRVQVKEGELEDLWPTAPGLPARSRDRGFRLACQSRPHSNCTISIRVPLRSGEEHPRPRRRAAKLVSKVALTHDITEFTFATSDAADFLAGQFALLSLPGVVGDRAYSMSNLPNAQGHWSFVIKRIVNGSGGAVLFDKLADGDDVMLDGPYGHSHLRADSPRDIVCIAGGSGLSPVLSILAAASRTGLASRKLQLFYGGRRPADLCASAMIEKDEAMRDRVECINAISDDTLPADQWTGERGFIHEVTRRRIEADGNAAGKDYYFCGPPMMADAVQRMLFELKVPSNQMFYDRFV